MHNIPNRIRSVISDTINQPAEDLHNGSHLIDDCGLDSLDTVEICMALEEEFDVEISDVEMEDTETFGDLTELIERLTKGS
jgi:acyl carrier protein